MGKRFMVEDSDLLTMYKEKGSIAETAIMCHASYSTIYKRLERLNALPHKTPVVNKEAAQAALVAATATIDKACTKGVYHKNNASRKVSRLAKAVNQMA